MAIAGLPVEAATRILGVSESGYYFWRDRPPPARAVRQAWLAEQIEAVHTVSRGVYRARRMHAELTLGLGIQVGHNAMEMLMCRAGLKGLPVDLAHRRHTRSVRRGAVPETNCGYPMTTGTSMTASVNPARACDSP